MILTHFDFGVNVILRYMNQLLFNQIVMKS